ncbi:Uncharacterised protein [Vibrio cholerae]|nr:Uncharacterised protein [Vibrio cholerae]
MLGWNHRWLNNVCCLAFDNSLRFVLIENSHKAKRNAGTLDHGFMS